MKRSNDFLVGAVVLSVILALTGATLWVKQSDIGERQTRVVARFRDVGNARVGNAVVIRGVRAGTIEAIELARAGWVDVRMQLDRSMQLPATPVVLLNESSLFGEWQATIIPRSALPHDETVQAQVEESSGGGDVLPGATLPDIAKLTAVAGQIAGDVANVAGRVEVAFDERAARELRGSIRNFSDRAARPDTQLFGSFDHSCAYRSNACRGSGHFVARSAVRGDLAQSHGAKRGAHGCSRR